MSLDERAFEASADAFRRTTARAADGGATRARVLDGAQARARRGALLRRATFALVAGLVAALSGSAAWTAIGRWRAAPTRASQAHAQLRTSETPTVAPRQVSARVDVEAPPAMIGDRTGTRPAALARPGDDGEARAYGRAHAAHFEADDPRRALTLWDAYLRDYPGGAFVPEARFNRALCLVRLGRRDEARAALRPFIDGAYGAYRRREAETLSDWIATRK